MSISNFVKKQFIDVIEWSDPAPDALLWQYPMLDREIQNSAQLVVREGQVAVFIDEGRIADTFGPGTYTLSTNTIPLLTNLRNWDKLFSSPFKSDVCYLSSRLQIDKKWGTREPITVSDDDFGLIRLRAHGNYSYRVTDPVAFLRNVSGVVGGYAEDDIQGQLRGLVVQKIASAIGRCKIRFVELASRQDELAKVIQGEASSDFSVFGLSLESVTLQSVSLPDDLQKILDQKIGLGIIGDRLPDLMGFQTAQSLPVLAGNVSSAPGGSSTFSDAIGFGLGFALSQSVAKDLSLQQSHSQSEDPNIALFAMIERLAELRSKGVLTEEEFSAKKAELLRKIN